MSRSVLIYTVVLLTFLIGCKADDSNKSTYSLDGNWEIYEAFRNDEITNTLEDGYFKFADSTLETNILGSPILGTFALEGNSFFHKSSLPAEYSISEYTPSTMVLKTEIRGFDFLFKLNKSNDSIPEN